MKTILITILCISASIYSQTPKVPWTADWSPDGKFIAVGGEEKGLYIYNDSLDLLDHYPFDNDITRLQWHPSQPLLAVVTQMGSKKPKASILNYHENKWVYLEGLGSGGRGIDWSKDGKFLVLGDNNGNVLKYTTDGNLVWEKKVDPKLTAGVSWHPVNNNIVVVGSTINILKQDGTIVKSYMPRDVEAFLLCVQWHPSGKYFSVGDYGIFDNAANKLIQFWTPEGNKLLDIPGSEGEYRNIRWNKAGDKLAAATDALRIYNETGDLLYESASSDDYLWGIDWSPDGKNIITSGSNGLITLWNNKVKPIKSVKY